MSPRATLNMSEDNVYSLNVLQLKTRAFCSYRDPARVLFVKMGDFQA